MSIKFAARAGVASLAAAIAAPAFAGPTYTTDNGGSFRWYGQFNPTYQSYDDGVDEYNRLVDNVNSNSRIGFFVTQEFGENTLQFNFETAYGFRSSTGVDQVNKGDHVNFSRTRLRKIDFAYKTARYGTFSFGQGAMASDGVTSADLSKTGVATTVTVDDAAGGYEFRDAAGALTSVSVGKAFETFDGGRLGRARYDSAKFAGFTFSTSFGTNVLNTENDLETYDVSVRYSNNDVAGFKVKGALGAAWTDQSGKEDKDDVMGSFSALHKATGLSVTVAAGDRNITGDYGYVKLGYSADLLSVGATSFSVDYYDGTDQVTDGDTSESWSVAAVQKFNKQNVEAYLAYRDYSYSDSSATEYQDSNVILAGARWKF